MSTSFALPPSTKSFGATFAPPITPVNAEKLGLAATMFVGVLLASLAPVLIIGRLAHSMGGHSHFAVTASQNTREVPRWRHLFILWVGRLSCFSGGVFLSTGFLDLFPDVEEAFEKAKAHLNINSEFPMAPCFTLLGFFTILTVEQVVLVFKESANPSQDPETGHRRISHDHDNLNESDDDDSPLLTNHHTPHHSIGSINDQTFPSIEGISTEPVYSRQNSGDIPSPNPSSQLDEEETHGGSAAQHQPHGGHDHSDHYEDLTMHSSLRVIILLCAMSIHAIFEGMAVGLQTTSEAVMKLFFALCLHKLVIAASVGLSVATSGLSRCIAITACLILSSASPLGVVCGFGIRWAEDNWGGGFVLVNSILQGFACGTFFYVVFFEILPHEFNTGLDRMGKVFSLLMGFGLVCLFIFFFPE